MTSRRLLLSTALSALVPFVAAAQDALLDPAALREPLAESWTSYSGDYTGQRFSALDRVDRQTVKHLTLAWTADLTAGPEQRLGPFGGGSSAPVLTGGEGDGKLTSGHNANLKGSILMVGDVLYVTSPDNVWAMDARDGTVLWRYFWETRGGTHIGNRGAAIWNDYLFFETPDNYLVSLDARSGEERWHVEIADFEQQYFSTPAPIVVDNHVLVGTGNDLDAPGFLQSFDPETGERQWIFYTVPMQKGDPGLETWPNLDRASHGGGQVWIPGSYDPETRLYIFGTGNPTPGYTGAPRPGDNLFTCTLIAVHVDTGKMAWYFQTSAHDTHDWDSAQTPVLYDAEIGGKMRKLVSTAARNGYFYTLDRVTGEHLLTKQFGTYSNWALKTRPSGVVEPNPEKEAIIPGSLVSPVEGGVVNWPPPAYSPLTGLFYTHEKNGFNMLYLTEPDPRGSMGLGGKERVTIGSLGNYMVALDPRTGEPKWRHEWPGSGGGGLLATAGNLIFTGDGSGNFVAIDATDGRPLWHSRIGEPSNAPQTYMVDGRQHVLVAVRDRLYAFTLY